MMLEKVERGSPVLVDGYNLTVQQCTFWKPSAGTGDMRELRSDVVSPTRPEHYSVLVSASETSIAVKLYFVEPFLAFGDSLDGEGIHRLDEPQLTRSKDAFGIPYFPRCIHLMSRWYICCWLRPDERPRDLVSAHGALPTYGLHVVLFRSLRD